MRADEEVLDKQEFGTEIFWLDEFEGEAKGGLWFRAFDLNKFIQKVQTDDKKVVGMRFEGNNMELIYTEL
tara:strand:- start:343 stop:552 length:210 start_codon:yes stop_codon:yes gene_type:complete